MTTRSRTTEIPRVGSRAQVIHGNAKETSGGLTKCDLKYNKHGEIVSRRASAAAKRDSKSKLGDYLAKKGEPFRLRRKGDDDARPKKPKKPTKRRR